MTDGDLALLCASSQLAANRRSFDSGAQKRHASAQDDKFKN
jgi:hypothetical protein